MPPKRHIMGLFKNEDNVVSAINGLKQSRYEFIRVNSPIPSHKIMDALKLKKSMVGWFTLCGGILGFIGGFALAIFTATRWNLIVSGKPIIAIIPFVIVGFEATILFSVFGNVIGLLTQTRLPSYRWLNIMIRAVPANISEFWHPVRSDKKMDLRISFKNRVQWFGYSNNIRKVHSHD